MGAAVRAADDNELAGLTKMTAFGRGLADGATVSMGRAAQRGASAAADRMRSAVDRKSYLMEGVGTGVGMYGATKGWLDSAETEGG